MNNEMNTISGDIAYVFGVGLASYVKKCEQASKKVEQLLSRLDSVMDKSFTDDNPTYVCGNALEDIKEMLDDTALQINHTMNVVIANAKAWESFPDDEAKRHGYVYGFMDAIEREA